MPNPVPLLFTYLFGEAAPVAYQGASERLLLWASAFDAWLGAFRLRRHASPLKQGALAWQRLLAQVRKMPWELTQADIEAHLAWLKSEGYAASTVNLSLRYISAFYRWSSLRFVDPQCPPAFNPAAEVSSPWPPHYTGMRLLSRSGVRRLLEVLRRDESPLGKRYYAFVLARLRLGVPTGQIQKLRWGQLEVSEGGANVRWREGSAPVRLPDEIWGAVLRYLSASGRLASLQPSAVIFAPLGIPTRPEFGDQASDWLESQVLSSQELSRNLKRYGALVGIPPRSLTLEGLRFTALRLKLDEGCSLEELKSFMDSRSPLKAFKYRLKNLPELPPDGGGAVSLSQTDQESSASLSVEVLSHKPLLFQPGEGYKHGMFAHSQPPEKVKAILAEDIHGIQEAYAGLYRLGQGLLERHTQASTASEMARLGDAYTLTAARLGEMLKAERERAGGKPGSRERRSQIESVVDWLVKTEASQGRPTSREAVLADLQAQAQGGGAELGLAAQGLEELVASMRLVLRNTLELALQAGSVDEYILLVNIYSSGCSRLVRMLRAGQVGDERLIHFIREEILRAIAEVSKEWDLGV